MIVFGLGTGRCGTQGLVNVFNTLVKEEIISGEVTMHREGSKIPWEKSYAPPPQAADLLSDLMFSEIEDSKGIYGDVASYHLPYVPYYMDYYANSNVRFIALQRDREETIDSYMHWTPDTNSWMDHDNSLWSPWHWDKSYPSYNYASSKREALGLFYEDYYSRCEMYSNDNENFQVFPMDETLNTIDGLCKLLEFIDVYPANVFKLQKNISEYNPEDYRADYSTIPIDLT
jgi:hypothetical protein